MRHLAIIILVLAASAVPGRAQGFHLPDGNRVESLWLVTDGNGCTWDVGIGNCCVGNGTHLGDDGRTVTYDGCLLAHIDGVRFDGPDGARVQGPPARYVDSPREIEGGPWKVGPLRISKRVHVPTDGAYCRWIDIYENTSDRDFAFTLRYRNDVARGIQQVLTASGERNVGEKDNAFLTGDGPGSGRLVLCHVFATQGAPLRPKVQIARSESHIIEYDWQVKIPAGQAAAFCLFESQQPSVEAAAKFLREFDPVRHLQGVSPALRRIIVNMKVAGAGLPVPYLPRSEENDRVVLADGSEMFGAVQVGRWNFQTSWGKMELAGDSVVGIIRTEEGNQPFAAILADGQVVFGRTAAGATLTIWALAGDTRQIEVEKVRSWGRRLDNKHPEVGEPNGPCVLLRSGDVLLFNESSLRLTLHSAMGKIELKAGDVVEIEAGDGNDAACAVTFSDGSRLSGRLEPDRMELALGMGPKLPLQAGQWSTLRFRAEPTYRQTPCTIRLAGADTLLGEWTDESVSLTVAGTKTPVRPASVKSVQPVGAEAGEVRVVLWDDSALQGRLEGTELSFRMLCGLSLRVPAAAVSLLARAEALPPEDLVKKVEQLVKQLGANDFKEREAATKDLSAMSPGIAPLLRRHAGDADTEVRERVRLILEALDAKGRPEPARRDEPREQIIRFKF